MNSDGLLLLDVVLFYARFCLTRLYVSGNNNAFPKEGLQWRGRSNLCNGNGCPGDDGEGGGCLEGSAAAGPDQLEGSGPAENDALHLKRRVGLISGVALIVGTMIG